MSEELQLISSAIGRTTPSPGHYWPPQLTQKLKVLLHAVPLLWLHNWEQRLEEDLKHYDALTLGVKLLDTIVEHTGIETEIDSGYILRALRPLLTRMDELEGIPPDGPRHEAMVERIIGKLRNDAEGQRPFQLAYLDPEGDVAVRRTLDLRLLHEELGWDNQVVLRLSNEAQNLFLRAIDLDIEDAQAAAEAVVASQLARGRFKDAVASAKHARLQSLRYATKIRAAIESTRRDVSGVDWGETIPELLRSALIHLQERLEVERSIDLLADTHLKMLDSGSIQAEEVAEIALTITDCLRRHATLHQDLMRARPVFLDEQARQRFIPRGRIVRPSLRQQVLVPLLNASSTAALTLLDRSAWQLLPAGIPNVPTVAGLLQSVLRPPRLEADEPIYAFPVEPVDLEDEEMRYDEPVAECAAGYLARAISPAGTSISALLKDAQAEGVPAAVQELLALWAFGAFGSEEDDESEMATVIKAERSGEWFETAGFSGDDLLLQVIRPESIQEAPEA